MLIDRILLGIKKGQQDLIIHVKTHLTISHFCGTIPSLV